MVVTSLMASEDGQSKVVGGYLWKQKGRMANRDDASMGKKVPGVGFEIEAIDPKTGDVRATYPSIRQAVAESGVSKGRIREALGFLRPPSLADCGGFVW